MTRDASVSEFDNGVFFEDWLNSMKRSADLFKDPPGLRYDFQMEIGKALSERALRVMEKWGDKTADAREKDNINYVFNHGETPVWGMTLRGSSVHKIWVSNSRIGDKTAFDILKENIFS